MPSNLTDNDILRPEEQYEYLSECARGNNLPTDKALSIASGVDPSFISRFKKGNIKNPTLIPIVRLFMAADASLDTAFLLKSPKSSEEDLEAELEKLKSENEAQKNKIAQFELEIDGKDKLLEERERTAKIEHEISHRKSRYLFVLTAILIFLVVVISGICIYDRFNPNVGWFRELYYNSYNDISTSETMINFLKG